MKFTKGILIVVFSSILFAGCVNIPIGDGKLKVSKDGVTITDEEGEEHNFSVNEEDELVTLEMDDGGITVGNDVAIPDSFPADIPIPEGVNIFSASEVQTVLSVAYDTEIAIEELEALYLNYLEGEVIDEMSTTVVDTDDIMLREYYGERSDGWLHVRIQAPGESENSTMVIIVFEGSGSVD